MNKFKNNAFVAALLAAFLGAAPAAEAAVVNFHFVPNSTLTLIAPNQGYKAYHETVTGSFSYDPTAHTVSAVDISVSGGVNATFLYSFDNFGNDSRDFGVSAAGVDNSGGILAYFQFTSALNGQVAVDKLVGSAIYNVDGNLFGDLGGGSATGGVSAVPEPSTWALMTLGFAGLGLFGYRARAKNGAARVVA